MSLFYLLTFTLVGLLSGAHCAGRCSGMIGAINSGLRPYSNRRPVWVFLTLGRLGGYGLVGLVAGSLGWLLVNHAPLPFGPRIALTLLAGVMLILMGISIAGRPAVLAWVERPGRHLWSLLQPTWRRYQPPNTSGRAFKAGLLWGWLPCGLVYAVLVSAVASGHPTHGLYIMLAFGLGTVPNVLAVAWMSGRWRHHFQNTRVRMFSGLLIILAGVQHALRLLHEETSGF